VTAVAPLRAVPENVVSVDPISAPLATVDLPTLWNLALANNPSLRETAAQLEATRGRLVQAGKYPNPHFIYEEDELGEVKGPAGTVRVSVSQEIVTAGKRRLDVAVAERGVNIAFIALLNRKFEVLARVRRAYYDYTGLVLASRAEKEVVAALEQAVQITRRLVEEAKTRPATDLIRIQALLEEARIGLERNRVQVEGAWQQLAAEVGTAQLPLPSEPVPPKTELENEAGLPQWDREAVLQRVLAANTGLKLVAAEADRARLELERAKAEAVPNVKLGGGYTRNFPELQAGALITVQTAIPVWDRKEGLAREAEARWTQAVAAQRSASARLSGETAAAYARYRSGLVQVERLSKEVLPRLRKNLELLQKGYQAGANLVTFSDILLAEEAVNRAYLDLAEARRNLWLAVADLQGLMQLDLGEELSPVGASIDHLQEH
jgi:cobalt-zinc-cadmium efflux system outer membrane protein